MRLVVLAAILMGGTAMVENPANKNPELLAISLIAKFEGFEAKPYTCPGGKATIGYGFTDPALIAKGTMTRKEADRILGKMVREELRFINERIQGLTPKQQAAVVSFIHNFGRTKFLKSKFYQKLQEHDIPGAQRELMDWVHVKKVNKVTGETVVYELRGLRARRSVERDWLS